MDILELLSESTIKIEEVKQEPFDSGDENIEEDYHRSIAVKSEPNTLDAAAEVLNDSDEEELKPLAAVFLHPNKESEENLEEQQDPFASGDVLHCGVKNLKVEETENKLSSPGWGDGSWEAEDQRDVQAPKEGGGPGNSACAFSTEAELTLYKLFPEAKSFQCVMCMKSLPETNTVASHITHSRGSPRVCSTCTKIFSARSAIFMPNPSAKSTSTERSECRNIDGNVDEPNVSPDCEKLKNRQASLKLRKNLKRKPFAQDIPTLPGDKPYQCGECNMGFVSKSGLNKHSLIHTGERPYECEECKKRFRTKGQFDEHRRIHTGEKPYVCGECKKRFISKSGLNRHNRGHTGEKPYECGECKTRFRRKSQVDEHSRVHTGTKPYECGECKKCFRTKVQLNWHCRIHTGEKPYECGECKKRFRTNSNLNQHSLVHIVEKPYECEECKKRFRTKDDVVGHIRNHAVEKPYECEECKKRFRTKSQLYLHCRIHTGEKPYECGECKKCFRTKPQLDVHCRIHTGEKPYECGECKKRFRAKSQLDFHFRVHSGVKPGASRMKKLL